ncbi:MAG: ABC transporter permease subunit [Phycisphaerales bacterium]|nr:ABC transporter permease subunit [Phycisphaerales bacterium]
MTSRAQWFRIHQDLSTGRRVFLKICAFVLPLALWCVVSYVPSIWHPDIQVIDVGDSAFFSPGMLTTKAEFAHQNAKLLARHERPATGIAANPVFLPTPGAVLKAFYTAFTAKPINRDEYTLGHSLWHSIQIIFWGFFASAVIGIPLGVLCGSFSFFAYLFEPFIDFIRYMPAPAFGALCVAIMGIADAPKIAIIFIGTFFQMVLVVANTTRLIDHSLLEAAQTLGARKAKLMTGVVLPAILPNLYNDTRILLGWAWTYLIIAELTGAASGISYFIYQQGRYFHFANVYVGIITIGIIGFVTDQVLAYLGKFFFPWQANGASFKSLFNFLLFLPRRPAKGIPRPAPAAPPEAPDADTQTAMEVSVARAH